MGSRRQESRVTWVIFEGGAYESELESVLGSVREAMVLDQVAKAPQVPEIDEVLVCTDRSGLAQAAEALGARVDLASAPASPGFHFGRRLQEVIARHNLKRVLYTGGAAAPLASAQELGSIARLVRERSAVVAANNIHSADLVAFAPAGALNRIEPPELDNILALRLHQEAGLPLLQLPRTLGVQFDVDTPTDMLILAVHPGTGVRTRARLAEVVRELNVSLDRFHEAKATLLNPQADVLIFGRVGAPLFSYLDEWTRCRVRLVSEERGMRSLGRERRGEVVSLIGYLIEAVGSRRFFGQLATLCGTAFLDSRVLFVHLCSGVSQADRFYSDLGRPECIGDPWVREFTEAAIEAEIPAVLGGHSLVTGGIWALTDAAYAEGLDRRSSLSSAGRLPG